MSISHILQSQPKLIQELENTECRTHGSLYQSVCLDPACLDSNRCFLCLHCIDDHPSHHKHANLSDVFSDKLLKDFNEFKSRVESEILDSQKKNFTIIAKVDDIFDCFE